MALKLPGLEETRAEIMTKMTESLHKIVYGGALDREIYRVLDTKGKNVTIHLHIPITIPPGLEIQFDEDLE